MFVEAFIAIASTFLLTLVISNFAKKSMILLSYHGSLLALGHVLLKGGKT